MLAKADDYSLTSIFVSYLDLKILKRTKLRYISAHMGVPSAKTTENSNFWLHLPICLHPGDQFYILTILTIFQKDFMKKLYLIRNSEYSSNRIRNDLEITS